MACRLFSGDSPNLEATLSSLRAQQTDLAQTITAFTAQAGQSTDGPPDGTLEASLSTATAAARLAATLSNISIGTPHPQAADPDARMLKSAKTLLFEDMSASRYIRIVKEALDEGGYFYLDVGSAKGWFKTQLLSGVEWDLVIAAAEADREFGGEFFEYIDTQLERGAGAVVENWDIDAAPNGKARGFLERCGVRYQSDWYEPELRVFYWLAPDHPVLLQPNKIPPSLRNSTRIWSGDLGDLLELDPRSGEGSATLLAGTGNEWETDHGVLASCVGGRVILQTFRTHEYHHDDMVALWQNYIYQTLKNHFALTGQKVPTPAITAGPQPASSPTPAGPTPGPGYIFEHGCDGILSVKLTDTPDYQRDLFEHHAVGEFLILRLQLHNQTNFPIQVWEKDYFIEANLGERKLIYSPHKAATGYLYIENPTNLSQDLIQPGAIWQTSVAFDVEADIQEPVFVFKPGSEFNEQICEVHIPLTE